MNAINEGDTVRTLDAIDTSIAGLRLINLTLVAAGEEGTFPAYIRFDVEANGRNVGSAMEWLDAYGEFEGQDSHLDCHYEAITAAYRAVGDVDDVHGFYFVKIAVLDAMNEALAIWDDGIEELRDVNLLCPTRIEMDARLVGIAIREAKEMVDEADGWDRDDIERFRTRVNEIVRAANGLIDRRVEGIADEEYRDQVRRDFYADA